MTDTGNILEIFSSYQGEGLFAGRRQVFVRFAGCHMRCAYCDTPESWKVVPTCRIASPTGGDDAIIDNPLTKEDIARAIDDHLRIAPHHSVSMTGGEPLLQTDFLTTLLPEIRVKGLPIYFETSGTLADKFLRVADFVDIAALDIKLPSCPGVNADWDDMRRTVRIARERCGQVMVKIVVRDEDRPEEIAMAIDLIRSCGTDIPLILQPVTPVNGIGNPPSWQRLQAMQAEAVGKGLTTHIIPQLHKIAGWR